MSTPAKASFETCATCKWSSDWTMTHHDPPRINPNDYGKCNYPLPEIPALPRCVPSPDHFHRQVIWPHYADCKVWTPQ